MERKSFFTTLKDVIIKFWYVFPLLAVVLLFILILLTATYPSLFENIVFCILLFTLIMLPVSWVVSIVFVGVLGFYLIFAAMSAPTTFGKDHPIPEGLAYNLPHRTEYVYDSISEILSPVPDSVVVDTLNADSYLQIWNGSQGGIYNYDFYYGPLPAGEIYLKCFEVTEDIPLSDYRLKKASKVKINGTSTFSKLVDKQRFTIYEGDWFDYYAARIEVWFKDAKTGDEKKLLEKVYRVEGWMR